MTSFSLQLVPLLHLSLSFCASVLESTFLSPSGGGGNLRGNQCFQTDVRKQLETKGVHLGHCLEGTLGAIALWHGGERPLLTQVATVWSYGSHLIHSQFPPKKVSSDVRWLLAPGTFCYALVLREALHHCQQGSGSHQASCLTALAVLGLLAPPVLCAG